MWFKINFTLELFILSVVASIECTNAWSQTKAILVPSQSSITIKGTSNVHDWEESVHSFQIDLKLKNTGKEITGIEALNAILKSTSIISDNNIMTNKTHDALKVNEHPEITFALITVDKLITENGQFSGSLTGNITLAGVTKRVSLSFSGNQSNNRLTIKGSKELNMNDFKIKPPTAMLGTLKTGDEVTVLFQLNFNIT